ncbi:quinone oxidoreductase family protein [Natronobacterium gregoryi]|uniref:NAD(P)H quinone oxidoreductase n=2 Tax=Natronobacterium gregoryi TaxID=44930 RepID=L0ANI7_NATGS|nr:NADPH:quinone oxidoreductase family protein [Natronobacterium gregoryi]AFZ74772.1 putative NAD(P)H quinone oxidoreductase, PIG3 family [Natronobacterium gregoryi SP2]ELY73557.1 NAD(P)H quinone oxidoreductase [Natronobacterium gregoryi SP2]PLK19415.1 NADPH:quinone oxidoreductase family protein [Natronobacterium gregoryi SP2]SFJ49503.1 NADPH2:quinone reductase [Natronobacterium gregoryi]
MRAIEVTEYGDSDRLEVIETDKPDPDAGEVRIEVEAAGINFADVMQRRGLYPGGPEAPYVPGMEAAGTIDATGEGVGLDEGDRVVAMLDTGGYAEYATANAQTLFPIPEGMSFEEAAGFPVQFLTAHSCLFEWGGLEDDETVLIQAAAGGVGTAAVQLASNAGAEVFGTASTDEKLELAADLGCDHPIHYTETDFRDVVDDETDGEGVDLVLESVGDDVFDRSLDAMKHFGRMVTFGVASGVPASAENQRLLFENKTVKGFHLGQAAYHDSSKVMKAVPDLTDGLTSGDLEVILGEEFDLEDAADAHQYIEDRKSSGKIVLKP